MRWIDTGEHPRLDFLKPGQGLRRWLLRRSPSITHLHFGDALDASDNEADITSV